MNICILDNIVSMNSIQFIANGCFVTSQVTNGRQDGKYIYIEFNNKVYASEYTCQKVKDLGTIPFCRCDIDIIAKKLSIHSRESESGYAFNYYFKQLSDEEVSKMNEITTTETNVESSKTKSSVYSLTKEEVTAWLDNMITLGMTLNDKRVTTFAGLSAIMPFTPQEFLSIEFLDHAHDNLTISDTHILRAVKSIAAQYLGNDIEADGCDCVPNIYPNWSVSGLYKYTSGDYPKLLRTTIARRIETDDAFTLLPEYLTYLDNCEKETRDNTFKSGSVRLLIKDLLDNPSANSKRVITECVQFI